MLGTFLFVAAIWQTFSPDPFVPSVLGVARSVISLPLILRLVLLTLGGIGLASLILLCSRVIHGEQKIAELRNEKAKLEEKLDRGDFFIKTGGRHTAGSKKVIHPGDVVWRAAEMSELASLENVRKRPSELAAELRLAQDELRECRNETVIFQQAHAGTTNELNDLTRRYQALRFKYEFTPSLGSRPFVLIRYLDFGNDAALANELQELFKDAGWMPRKPPEHISGTGLQPLHNERARVGIQSSKVNVATELRNFLYGIVGHDIFWVDTSPADIAGTVITIYPERNRSG